DPGEAEIAERQLAELVHRFVDRYAAGLYRLKERAQTFRIHGAPHHTARLGTLKGSRTPRDGLARASSRLPHTISLGTLKGSRTPRDGLVRASSHSPTRSHSGPSKGPDPPAMGSREQARTPPHDLTRDPQRVPNLLVGGGAFLIDFAQA